MYEFRAHPAGDVVLATAVCPLTNDLEPVFPSLQEELPTDGRRGTFIFPLIQAFTPYPGRPLPTALGLGARDLGAIQGVIVSGARYTNLKPQIQERCLIRDEIHGQLRSVDPYNLGGPLRRRHTTVTPYYDAAEAIAANQGNRTQR
jgi:hypothetical protein